MVRAVPLAGPCRFLKGVEMFFLGFDKNLLLIVRPIVYTLAAQFVFGLFAVSAQTSPSVLRFESPGFDVAAKSATDQGGNIYIAASIPRPDAQTAFAVLKYDPQGRFVWVAHFNDSGNSFGGTATAVSVDSIGNVYAVGSVQPELVSYVHDFLIVKFNSSGVQEWADRIPNGSGSRIAVGPEGSIYSTGNVGGSWLTLKHSHDGSREWQRTGTIAGQPGLLQRPMDMGLDSDGHVIVTGISRTAFGAPPDVTTIKYDPKGNEVFRQTFSDGELSEDIPFALDIDASGNVWITGLTQATIYDPLFALLLKYDAGGSPLLALRRENAGGLSIHVDGSGDVFVAGLTAAGKYSSAGARLWERPLTFQAVRIVSDSLGNSYVAGSQYGTTTGDYLTVKYGPQGDQIFQHTFNGEGNGRDAVSDMLLDSFENVVVVGTSRIDTRSFEDIVALRFLRDTFPTPQPLGAPSGLEAFGGRNRISIRWQDNSSTEDGFRIERCEGSSCTNFAQIAEVGANTTWFNNSGLSRNTTYRYRVRAFNGNGNSDYSNIAIGRTTRR